MLIYQDNSPRVKMGSVLNPKWGGGLSSSYKEGIFSVFGSSLIKQHTTQLQPSVPQAGVRYSKFCVNIVVLCF